jgi:pyruvate/2-oxoglutarate dehydrogenase complex dihydrolipoamide acyltransferase (E2) component
MATDIILPQIGFSMSEATLVEWFAQDGATVTAGDNLYSIESDKSVNEVEAPATGTLRIKSEVGEVYPVGHILATIE